MTPIIQQLRHDAEEGNRDPLEILIELRAFASEIDEAIDAVTPLAVAQADKHPGKSFEFHGFVIEKRDGTRRWSYPAFTPYENLKAKAKGYEDMMKQVQATGAQLYDAESGELVPAAIVSVSKPTIAIRGLKK